MFSKKLWLVVLVCVAVLALVAGASAESLPPSDEDLETLGELIFFDTNLSTPPGQSCAACHAPNTGFTGPDSAINATLAVYPGAIHTRFGNRKPPTAAYGGESPVLYFDEGEEVWVGGMFWDGRATGWTLGDPLAEQAQGPFLNPLEQNMSGAKQVCLAMRKSNYVGLFETVWGPGSFDCVKDVDGTYERIARSIAAYERSAEVNPFNSKFDLFWDNATADEMDVTAIDMDNQDDYLGYGLDKIEVLGLALFNDEDKGMCSLCHLLTPGESGYPVFTDFTYDNLGIPKNPDNPFYTMPRKWNPDGANWIDPGLGGFLMSIDEYYENEWGKHKVPTLRNVDMRPYPEFVKAYGHNGYFKSLEEITHFYNTRDVEGAGWPLIDPELWPPAEYAETVNTDELGDLELTLEEEAAIVAFMKTLSDGYVELPQP